jgi:FtsZ-binding cell division protein ZapB
MNANELADALDTIGDKYLVILGDIEFKKAADFVRQQQYEIEDLKNANRFIQNFAEEQHQRAVALEMRELTDDEIRILINEVPDYNIDIHDLMEFARAILRKAQEK